MHSSNRWTIERWPRTPSAISRSVDPGLRAAGIRVRIAEADEILIKTAWGLGTGESQQEKREVYKSKTQIARERARADGRCIM